MHTRVYCPLLLPLYCVFFFTILRNSNVAMFPPPPPPRLQLSSLPPSALYLGESSPARSESHYSLQLQPTCVLCSMQALAAAQWKGLTALCLHFQIWICFAARQWCLWNARTKACLSGVFFFCCFCSLHLGCIRSNNGFCSKILEEMSKGLPEASIV